MLRAMTTTLCDWGAVRRYLEIASPMPGGLAWYFSRARNGLDCGCLPLEAPVTMNVLGDMIDGNMAGVRRV